MGAFDFRSILHILSPSPLGMQLFPETLDAAPGTTVTDLVILGSWGTTLAQSQLQALASRTSFGNIKPTLSRLQQHGALFFDEDVLMTDADLPSHITARHYSQGGSSYTTAPANGRNSFVSGDAVQTLATLRDRHA